MARPDRIVIDGSQANHEAIVSCDAANRLRDSRLLGYARSAGPLRHLAHERLPVGDCYAPFDKWRLPMLAYMPLVRKSVGLAPNARRNTFAK